MKTSALEKQVGGTHYKYRLIQPVEFAFVNNLGFIEGNVIKYLCRYKTNTGKEIQDLQKAQHYLELLIELHKKYKEEDSDE